MVVSRNRSGFSFLDLIVVLLLLVLLVGLGILYLQRQRTVALRVECALHLKRLGDAIQAFEKKNIGPHTLPAGRIAEGYATWAVQVVPYLTSDNPLMTWDLGLPVHEQAGEVRGAWLPEFFCPARHRKSKTDSQGSMGDYAGAAGTGPDWTGPAANGPMILGDVLQREGDRILAWKGRLGLSNLVRGLSNTLLIGEKHVPIYGLGQRTEGDGAIVDGSQAMYASRVGGAGWPIAKNPSIPFSPIFGSWHPDVCQFIAADGSLKALTPSISPEVFGKLLEVKE